MWKLLRRTCRFAHAKTEQCFEKKEKCNNWRQGTEGKIVQVRCIREQEHIALRFFCLLSFTPPKRKPQGLQQHPGVFHTSRITGHPESSATGFNLRIDESNGRR